MKQGFYLIMAFLSFCSLCYGDPRNADVPMITSLIEQRDGSKISLRYPAIHWPATIQSATDDMELVSQNLTPNMATMETNVQLQIGRHKVDPGRYQLGITHQSPDTWNFHLQQDEEIIFQQEMQMQTADFTKNHVLFLFEPGITPRDFIFSFQYGNLFTSFRWTITGVPTQPSTSGTKSASAPITTESGQARQDGVESTQNDDTEKDKAGSGAFRKLRKKEDNQDS